jgi:hypothetical protein
MSTCNGNPPGVGSSTITAKVEPEVGRVIVVVEGPSAAGKSTWITSHCDSRIVVPETSAAEAARAPDRLEQPEAAAEFWTELNISRWGRAERIAHTHGVAVCDSDPFKLHYSWALWRTGHASRHQWRTALAMNRQAFSSKRLGLADLILVTIPGAEALIRHDQADPSRRRHNFDLHLQLAGPLAEWYHAIGQLDPTRVTWELPPDGLPADRPPRDPNSGTELLDAFLAHLPAT